jgi:hypothetical protein
MMGITGEQLLEVFAAYNLQIWPMQYVAYLFGIAGLVLAIRKTRYSGRVIPAILGFFWLWVAILFWLPAGLQGFPPGYIFAALFLVQGLLFLVEVFKPRLAFGYRSHFISWVGIFFGLYALIGYPVVGYLLGHIYPQAPPFGLTPCPVVTFTFGLLLLAERKVPKSLLVIPLFYALSGILWASIGILEDIGMFASGVLGAVLIWHRDSKSPAAEPDKSLPAALEGGWSLDVPEKKS